jgi:hypothetical protein
MNTDVNLVYFTLLMVSVVTLLIYLATRSGRGYSVQDMEAHAERYAGIVEESRGGMTAFCWITIGAIFIWSVIYLVMHWSEYSVVFFR